ncbi:hypothetical protein UlMin_023196 [Ulmus minor]
MDAKALAKSKRAHSQHLNKKHHSNPKLKASSGGGAENNAGVAKKPSGKQVTVKPHQSKLPSNWDRYEEENDSGSEDPSVSGVNPASDVVLPKSKGADYCYLIAEAQSQFRSSQYLDTFPTLDVLSGDFSQAAGSLLSVKGEGILSWSGDDNFIVEDKRTHHEASFLSLNLHALAEQLEKVDLSQRLFIEADLLPPELCAEVSEARSTQERDQIQATIDNEAELELSEELIFDDSSAKVKVADQTTEVKSSVFPDSGHQDPSLSVEGSIANNEANINRKTLAKSNHHTRVCESASESTVLNFPDSHKKLPKFEAAAAEAELDMLLDSFTEIKSANPSGFSSAETFRVQQEASLPPFQLPRKDPDSSLLTIPNFDDDLDDLLKQTSSTSTNQNNIAQPLREGAVQFVQSSNSGTKLKALDDDFDSWLDTI